jgi:hypothetical protein
MFPLTLSAESISKSIREKKKRLLTSEPSLIDTSPTPDMDAQDVYDLEQDGRIESTLDSPKKINATDTMLNQSYDGVGLSPEEKTRMGRLRKYFDTFDMSGK